MFNSASVSVKTEPIDYIDKLSRSPSPQSDNDYPSPPKLRTYQQEAVDAVLTAIEEEGLTRIGVSAPTGGGKTTIFATIIREILKDQRKGKVLVLVGSEEQAIQAKIKIEDVHGRYRPLIGHERNTQRATRRDEVIIATYQTLGHRRRMDEFKRTFNFADFKLVVVDEAHHSVSNSYLQILSEFNNEVMIRKSSIEYRRPTHGLKIPIVGVSATFTRHDKRELRWVYEQVVYKCSLDDTWAAGHLVPVRIWKLSQEPRDSSGPSGSVQIKESLVPHSNRRAPTSEANPPTLEELSFDEINRIAGTQRFNKEVLKYFKIRAVRRKSTLIFSKDLKYVDDLTKLFVEAGIKAKAVTSRTSKIARQDNIASFERGDCSVLITCLALSEGSDAPQIDCIILANPTDSKIRHTQMVGRATRLSPKTGKVDCLIIDLVANCDRFPLGVEPSLSGNGKRKAVSDEDDEG